MAIPIPKEGLEHPPGTLAHLMRRVERLLSSVEALDKLADRVGGSVPQDESESVFASQPETVSGACEELASRVVSAARRADAAIDRIHNVIIRM